MTDQGNLFAAPQRPTMLHLAMERKWHLGEDAWELRATTWGSKTSEMVWSIAVDVDGPHADEWAADVVSGLILRFGGSNWGTEPKVAPLEKWDAHRHRI